MKIKIKGQRMECRLIRAKELWKKGDVWWGWNSCSYTDYISVYLVAAIKSIRTEVVP